MAGTGQNDPTTRLSAALLHCRVNFITLAVASIPVAASRELSEMAERGRINVPPTTFLHDAA